MLFSQEEELAIAESIRAAEHATTGEIRLYVEDFCFRDHPVERAAEIFHLFGMHHTHDRNAVLVYIAEKSRQFAFWGDEGIHQQVGTVFWQTEKQILRDHLQRDAAAEGICRVIEQIGGRLRAAFPAEPGSHDNELPDEIIYG